MNYTPELNNGNADQTFELNNNRPTCMQLKKKNLKHTLGCKRSIYATVTSSPFLILLILPTITLGP